MRMRRKAALLPLELRQQLVPEEIEVMALAEERGQIGGDGIAEVLQFLGIASLDERR